MTPASLDARALAQLASESARMIYAHVSRLDIADRLVVRVWTDVNLGYTWATDAKIDPDSDHVFSATLAPENTASEEALTRALLASAITVEQTASRDPHDAPWVAFIGSDGLASVYEADGNTEAEAREALLDSLLAETQPEVTK
jgi:hypothetical protein